MTATSTGTLGKAAAVAHFERGHVAHQAGQPSEAIAAYRTALMSDPTLAPAHFNLGQLLLGNRAFAEASDCFQAAARLRPEAADAWLHFGVCRERLGDLDQAGFAYERTLALAPNSAAGFFNLGNIRRQQGRLRDAETAFEAANQLTPESPAVLLNLGNVLRELGQLHRAMPVLELAAEKSANPAEARWSLALCHLAGGQLERGWTGYEFRWARAGLSSTRGLPWPLWQGESLVGKRMLVWREQGLGDELLFATCLPDLLARGGDLTVAVDPRLVGLVSRAFPNATVVAEGEWGDGPFDYHVPLGSLPQYLRRQRGDFRSPWSFLVPDRHQIGRFRDRLKPFGAAAKIGICWRSGLRSTERVRCYPDIDAWKPVLAAPETVFVSLQYDDAEAELLAIEAATGIRVHRWSDLDLRDDLEATTALIWNLDLVITAPTAVSSLAGALGIETWQIDPGTDWTCFGETRSPWFPAIRTFSRDPASPTWGPVLDEVVGALTEWRNSRADVNSSGSERS